MALFSYFVNHDNCPGCRRDLSRHRSIIMNSLECHVDRDGYVMESHNPTSTLIGDSPSLRATCANCGTPLVTSPEKEQP